ncbi:MAG: adenosine kinase [Actinomycetota bacterium]|nr:adenosine kinase [Actinomycetota bacterium]
MERAVDIVTVGHAIVDVLAPSDDELVSGFGLTKGTMTLVDDARAELIYGALGVATTASGGSAANTAVCLASLGTATAFVGKVRDDHLGEVFTNDIRSAGVDYEVPPGNDGPGTGRCLIMVTSDAEKTMCTSLGIGDFLPPEDIDIDTVAAARVVYVEGYLCGLESTDATVERIVAAAHESDTLVSLSLSDPFWVQLHGDVLRALLPRVDVLFANEDEACGLAGTDDVNEAVTKLAAPCATVVVTLGAKGSIVATADATVSVPAETVSRVIDSTGAGDSFAAGFLHAMVRGADPGTCARLGGLVAAEIVSHLGARPLVSLADLAASAGLSA